jgi:hypothetical protein
MSLAIVFDALEIDAESVVELFDGAGQDYGPPCWAFLHDRQAVGGGEFFHRLDIGRIGSEFLRKCLALHGLWRPAGAVKRLDFATEGIIASLTSQ